MGTKTVQRNGEGGVGKNYLKTAVLSSCKGSCKAKRKDSHTVGVISTEATIRVSSAEPRQMLIQPAGKIVNIT